MATNVTDTYQFESKVESKMWKLMSRKQRDEVAQNLVFNSRYSYLTDPKFHSLRLRAESEVIRNG